MLILNVTNSEVETIANHLDRIQKECDRLDHNIDYILLYAPTGTKYTSINLCKLSTVFNVPIELWHGERTPEAKTVISNSICVRLHKPVPAHGYYCHKEVMIGAEMISDVNPGDWEILKKGHKCQTQTGR